MADDEIPYAFKDAGQPQAKRASAELTNDLIGVQIILLAKCRHDTPTKVWHVESNVMLARRRDDVYPGNAIASRAKLSGEGKFSSATHFDLKLKITSGSDLIPYTCCPKTDLLLVKPQLPEELNQFFKQKWYCRTYSKIFFAIDGINIYLKVPIVNCYNRFQLVITKSIFVYITTIRITMKIPKSSSI